MLFSIDPNTRNSKIFSRLNREFLYFLRASINGTQFNDTLFSQRIGKACFDNEPTRIKFEALWNVLSQKTAEYREQLYLSTRNSQNIESLFNDRTSIIFLIDDEPVFNAIKSLTSHLYTRTKKLTDVKAICKDTIHLHYYDFTRLNSQLCFVCGTRLLSHDRDGLDVEDQWLADYDHLLCHDKYPIFSIHPKNFLPTCDICNSKAKGANDLLRDPQGNRRLAFYPSTNSCFSQIRASLVDDFQVFNLQVRVEIQALDQDFDERVSVWNEIYQVPSRVELNLTDSLISTISSDLKPASYQEFIVQLSRHSQNVPADIREKEWRFWWFRLYQWLDQQNAEIKILIWTLVEKQVNDNAASFQAEFGI